MVRGVSWWCWMELSTVSATLGFSVIVCYPEWWTFLDETLFMSRTMPLTTQHVTRLLFWQKRMWRSWTGQLGVQTSIPLSMFRTKWGSRSETWMAPLPLCQKCGVLSSRRVLQFAQEGWGPWWTACHVIYVLFSPLEGSHKVLVVWWHGCKHISHIHEKYGHMSFGFLSWSNDFNALFLHCGVVLRLFVILHGAEPVQDWGLTFYQLLKPDISKLFSFSIWAIP